MISKQHEPLLNYLESCGYEVKSQLQKYRLGTETKPSSPKPLTVP